MPVKKYLYKTALFLLPPLVVFCLLAFVFGRSTDKLNNDFMAAVLDKHAALEKTEPPRIIIDGGSNLAFGINSAAIEQALNMPVINLGMHAGLGVNFMIEELKTSVRSGDIVFLSFEYLLDAGGDYRLKKQASHFYQPAAAFFDPNLFSDLSYAILETRSSTRSFLLGLVKKVAPSSPGEGTAVYSRRSFNTYGDAVAHLDKPKPAILSDRGVFKYRYWEGIGILNRFYAYAKARNCRVYFLYPNYPISEYRVNGKVIEHHSNDLSSGLQVPILNTPTDFLYEDSLFFDTIYHLSGQGREKRTSKLIELIRQKGIINAAP